MLPRIVYVGTKSFSVRLHLAFIQFLNSVRFFVSKEIPHAILWPPPFNSICFFTAEFIAFPKSNWLTLRPEPIQQLLSLFHPHMIVGLLNFSLIFDATMPT